MLVHSLKEGLSAVDEYAGKKYQQIKLYSSIDPSWVAPLAARAHAAGLRVCGHIPSFMTAEEAVKAGYDEITHMNMVMLNFQGDTIDTRAMRRFAAVGERGWMLDTGSADVNRFIRLLREKHVAVDPTIQIFSGMLTLATGDSDGALKPVIGWMPPDQREQVRVKSSYIPPDGRQTYLASFAKMLQMLRKLYDSGILIVAGTDGGEAFALERELELYVEAGIPPMNALQCATYNAAKDCNLLDTYGTIAEGKPADMILIDGNPGVTVSDIRRVEWVIKNNRRYAPKRLYGSMGWSYYY
jgi:imidazolonepropionase-like amidohydrolase